MKDPRTIISKLLVTEKSTSLKARHNQHLFRVASDANRIDIGRAVEAMFNVKVVKVNTMTRQGKRKRLRMMKYGRTSDWKRAVVTLAAGHTIELT